MIKLFYFDKKMTFEYVEIFLLDNKKLFRTTKNGVRHDILGEVFKKI